MSCPGVRRTGALSSWGLLSSGVSAVNVVIPAERAVIS
jgi:hypothetical protein